MTLTELHRRLRDDALDLTLLPRGRALPYLTALAILARVSGVPLAAVDNSSRSFDELFPKNRVPSAAAEFFGGEVPRYNNWRNLLLDALCVARGTPAERDPWDGLRRVARISRGSDFSSRLYHLSARVPHGVLPSDLHRALALEIDAALRDGDRRSFRQGLGALDALHSCDFACGAGVLPSARIGSLPKEHDHEHYCPLPSGLQAAKEQLSRSERNALVFTWRLSVIAGIWSEEDNPSPPDFIGGDRAGRLLDLDPKDYGFERPTLATYGIYLRLLGRAFGRLYGVGLLRERSEPEVQWAQLRTAIKEAELLSKDRIGGLSAISTPALRDKIGPRDLLPEWFAARSASLDPIRRRAFESACYALNDLYLREGSHAALLPQHGTGIRRQRKARGP